MKKLNETDFISCNTNCTLYQTPHTSVSPDKMTLQYICSEQLGRIVFHRNKNSSPVIISEQAFRNCVSLKQVRGSALLRLNEGYEFLGCKSMKQTPAGICGEIKKGAFQDCSSLELLNFHYVTKIDDDAFDKNNHIAAVYVGRDFECSETFLESIKNARIICYKESKFVDLVYNGYHVVL